MRTSIALVVIAVLGGCTDPKGMTGGGDDGSDGSGSGSGSATALSATDDALAIEMNGSGQLAVLANDTGVDPARVLTIVEMPTHGGATLGEDGVLTYHTSGDYLGADAVTYEVANPDGDVSSATVAITVGCATCALGVPITLAWDPITDPTILGFRLYSGATDDTTTMTKIDDIAMTRVGFDPTAPQVAYDAWFDLHLRIGDNVCFALTDYNADLESGFSNVACAMVNGQPMNFSPN